MFKLSVAFQLLAMLSAQPTVFSLVPQPLPHQPKCSPLTVNARIPPSLNPNVNSSPPAWASPPSGWFYGNWKLTQSSNPLYSNVENLEYIGAPVPPTCTGTAPADCPPGTFPGQNVDLVIYSAPGTNTSSRMSTFGYDTPRQANYPELGGGWNTTYDYIGTGRLSQLVNSWEMLTWGYDEGGVPYFVAYETAASFANSPAGLDIESRSSSGPSSNTYQAILNALKALGCTSLTMLVDQVVTLPRTADEDSLPPFMCDTACQNNTAS